MNYCKEIRIVTNDGIHWRVENETDTFIDIHEMASLGEAWRAAEKLASSVDLWAKETK